MKTEDPALFHAVENNTLLNDVFFYVLHHLPQGPQLQNMHEYMVPAQDIDGAGGDIVDVPAGDTMSGDEEEEESTAPAAAAASAPAAAAESCGDGAGPPTAGAVDA
jgi:hypothetical protein